MFGKNYGETCSVKYYRVLTPKQLVDQVFGNLHIEFGRPPGDSKTLFAYNGKYYYKNKSQLIVKWVMPCEQCIKESRIDNRLIRNSLGNHSEHITEPEDVIQIDLVPGKPPSGGYQNFVTAMDAFWRYLFAYLTTKQDARTVARVKIYFKTKHA